MVVANTMDVQFKSSILVAPLIFIGAINIFINCNKCGGSMLYLLHHIAFLAKGWTSKGHRLLLPTPYYTKFILAIRGNGQREDKGSFCGLLDNIGLCAPLFNKTTLIHTSFRLVSSFFLISYNYAIQKSSICDINFLK